MIVYLDTETTGLDPDRHEVWGIAWAVDDGPIRSAVVPHSLRHADPEALRIGGHDQRCNLGAAHDRDPWLDCEPPDWVAEDALHAALTSNTLAGANPAFDAGFLRARWGETPWRYRLLDVEAYAMGALGYAEPRGLATIAADLRALGFAIPEPDHTAAGDVACVRECHRALMRWYAAARFASGAVQSGAGRASEGGLVSPDAGNGSGDLRGSE